MLADFFKEIDDTNNGKYSVSRLVYFLSFFPAAYHVFMTGQDMSMFITTYTAGYLGGKHGGNLIDAIGNKNTDLSDLPLKGGTHAQPTDGTAK